ncbi:MAG TPA: LysE family transporter [Anaerolineales bacterium]|nr:LysE family transporter [Anaerolineales bacterium]HNE67347.1 LysE family transporter [Anaerolineales bacterium]
MWFYLLQGIGFGFAAASQPGPFQTYLISQTLTRGWKHTLPAALAPLVSDGPIILLCVLVLSQVPAWMQRGLYIAGGLFIIYLAYGTYRTWENFDTAAQTTAPAGEVQQSVLKAAMMNALNPNPYIFWTLVTGPILLSGWRQSPILGVGFLAAFYLTMIAGLAAVILIFGFAQRFGAKFNRMMLGISAIALFCFGIYQLWLGLFPKEIL